MRGVAGRDLRGRDCGVAARNDGNAILAGDRRADRCGGLQMTGGVLLGRTEEAALLAGAFDIEGGAIGRLGNGNIVLRLEAKRAIGRHRRADDVDVVVGLGDQIATGSDGGAIMRQRRRGALTEGRVRLVLRGGDVDVTVRGQADIALGRQIGARDQDTGIAIDLQIATGRQL